MKKIITSLLAIFILNACSSSSDTNTKSFKWTWYTINIPSSWINVNDKEMPNPWNWKIELALTSSEISAWFANNMIILSEDLNSEITSSSYSITNYVRTTWSVKDYTKLEEKDFKFSDNDEWKIYVFEAKYNLETPKRKFIQTAKVCDKKAYLMTIWINLDNENTSKYQSLLQSFECAK